MNAKYFFGTILIVMGVGFLISQAGIIDFWQVFWNWWPILVVGAGFYHLINNRRSLFNGIATTVVGILLLLSTLDILNVSFWNILWPSVLILLGASLMMRSSRKHDTIDRDEEKLNINTLFSGSKQRMQGGNFTGGQASTMFGGAEIDLSESEIRDGYAEIDLSAIFGGIELRVPAHWDVYTKGMPLFGGIDNKLPKVVRTGEIEEKRPRLVVNCFVMFGGIEIKD
jgi:predicted membrane protein